jgi:hypothetical protein
MGFRYGLVIVLLVEGGITSLMEGMPSDGRRSYVGRPLPALDVLHTTTESSVRIGLAEMKKGY